MGVTGSAWRDRLRTHSTRTACARMSLRYGGVFGKEGKPLFIMQALSQPLITGPQRGLRAARNAYSMWREASVLSGVLLWVAVCSWSARSASEAPAPPSILDAVPPACNPKPANDPDCNPYTGDGHCTAYNDSGTGARCVYAGPGMRAFCGYASMRMDGYASDLQPQCALTGKLVAYEPSHSPFDAYVTVGTEFNCFNSSKDAADRLCITRAYQRSIDCVFPASTLPGLLHRLLARGETDFVHARGRLPQFQCFHRGGFGSVPWLHLHSFDGHADSICPLMSTSQGSSPNPLPHKITCAVGAAPVTERVTQILRSMRWTDPG